MSQGFDDPFEEEWKEAFEGAELSPLLTDWDSVKRELNRKRFIFWRNTAIITAGIVFIATSLYLFQNTDQPEEKQLSRKVQTQESTLANKQKAAEKSSVVDFDQKNGIRELAKLNKIQKKPFVLPADSGERKELDIQSGRLQTLPFVKEQPSPPDLSVIPSIPMAGKSGTYFSKKPFNAVNPPPRNQMDKKSKWWTELSLGTAQVNRFPQAAYGLYMQDYMQAHRIGNVVSNDFFEGVREETTRPLPINAAVKIGYKINQKLTIQTGLQLQTLQFGLKSNSIFKDYATGQTHSFIAAILNNELNNTGLLNAMTNHPAYQPNQVNNFKLEHFNESQSAKLQFKLSYLALPLELSYAFFRMPAFELRGKAGITGALFLKKAMQAGSSETADQISEASFRNLIWNASLGAELLYHWNDKLSWNLSPDYSLPLLSYTKNNYLDFRPKSWSVNLGLRYRF